MTEITLEEAAREIIRHCNSTEPEMVQALTERILQFIKGEQISMALGITALYRAANIGVKCVINEARQVDSTPQFKPRIIKPH